MCFCGLPIFLSNFQRCCVFLFLFTYFFSYDNILLLFVCILISTIPCKWIRDLGLIACGCLLGFLLRFAIYRFSGFSCFLSLFFVNCVGFHWLSVGLVLVKVFQLLKKYVHQFLFSAQSFAYTVYCFGILLSSVFPLAIVVIFFTRYVQIQLTFLLSFFHPCSGLFAKLVVFSPQRMSKLLLEMLPLSTTVPKYVPFIHNTI